MFQFKRKQKFVLGLYYCAIPFSTCQQKAPEPMKATQRIALEMSTKREALNALLGLDEMSDEQRTEMGGLTTGLQELEVEARAAIMAEDVPRSPPPPFRTAAKTASCDP